MSSFAIHWQKSGAILEVIQRFKKMGDSWSSSWSVESPSNLCRIAHRPMFDLLE